MSPSLSTELDRLVDTLPDPAAARIFVARLAELHPHAAERWLANDVLMSNVLALVVYSPLLGQTLLQQPEHLNWLARERDLQIVKPKERLREQVARFAARHSTLSEQVALARFKRRELLRIYLRDCLGYAALSETTAELSNLADVLLERTLNRCRQALEKEAGVPSALDERGRLIPAEFAVVALGKLGSRELNYSSDIDLLFLYSVDGETQSGPTSPRPLLTNKQFYTRLAERIVGVIGKVAGEGAVYRTDLRLRPRGRMGDLVVSLKNAVIYYRDEAQNWERQSLIKARCAAGSEALVSRFLSELADAIYPLEGWRDVVRDVRQSKEKIDRQQTVRGDEDNVKLGRGGIREIEFIVQALQLYYGGRDPWIRSPNTLIGIDRLTERGYLTEKERTQLSGAYTYLRTLEHRLQMEHGVQTHSLPTQAEKIALVSRRMAYPKSGEGVLRFKEDLLRHRANVSGIFANVFSRTDGQSAAGISEGKNAPISPDREELRQYFPFSFEEASRLISEIEQSLSSQGVDAGDMLREAYPVFGAASNPLKALRSVRRFIASIETATAITENKHLFTASRVRSLVALCARSGYFSEMLTSHPRLFFSLPEDSVPLTLVEDSRVFVQKLQEMIGEHAGLAMKMDALRTLWWQEVLQIGCLDVFGHASMSAVNRAQTALARGTIEVATAVTLDELSKKYYFARERLLFAILGLGRISHAGVDYGSDLDLLFVFDDMNHDCIEGATLQEFYSDFVETIVRVLSTLTKEGSLYRVDLRLRPDGSKGMLASSIRRLVEYIRAESQTWELLAYVKTRPVGGNPECGRDTADAIGQACFDASRGKETQLAEDIHAIREKLHREKVNPRALNIKWGAGAMFDVYFATRFLQLTHAVRDPEEAGTLPLVSHLHAIGLLSDEQYQVLREGYRFLRNIDHELRLYFPRRVYSLPSQQPQLAELSRNLGLRSADDLLQQYRERTEGIERVYSEIVKVTPSRR